MPKWAKHICRQFPPRLKSSCKLETFKTKFNLTGNYINESSFVSLCLKRIPSMERVWLKNKRKGTKLLRHTVEAGPKDKGAGVRKAWVRIRALPHNIVQRPCASFSTPCVAQVPHL